MPVGISNMLVRLIGCSMNMTCLACLLKTLPIRGGTVYICQKIENCSVAEPSLYSSNCDGNALVDN